ncbi:MAG: [FeFe] hydrogenase, group A [Bacteroidetes bacterium]|nr:[FeFe] hydrogenase, group A [Bacteroidota bacterium]
MEQGTFLYVNGKKVYFDSERNVLEILRKANIDMPTFCYHSELSVYGACRLCVVEVEGRGIVSSCSTKPEPGLRINTSTSELREIRKISLELLLASHHQECTSCIKSSSCKLQEIARKLGVTEVRFSRTEKKLPVDSSTHGLLRNPNKCILCGDCVRACSEIQGIGAIDFAYRGHDLQVMPSFGQLLGEVQCVECGQCARVCPTGALTPKVTVDQIWSVLENKEKVVLVQVAPAVRVALGEVFNLDPGTDCTEQMVSALKLLGFKKVFDTSFAADLTIIEETNEFIQRKQRNKNLPLLTSCCPGWVKFAELYFPDLLGHLSTCRSPQQMFGAIAKRVISKQLGIPRERIVMVSVMPCTAKRGEASRPEFADELGIPDVDFVITTQELALMIQQAGLDFKNLPPESFDLPFGFKTGAGVLFGASGGVSEAVIRFAAEKLTGQPLEQNDITEVRGENGIRHVTFALGEHVLRLAIVHGLRNARRLLNEVKKGKLAVDFIEVMACPGGCIGGGGQPVYNDISVRKARAKALYRADKNLQLHRSQDNPYIGMLYESVLREPGSHEAHTLLHTKYINRASLFEGEVILSGSEDTNVVEVKLCLGPQCLSKGSDELLNKIVNYIAEEGLTSRVMVVAHSNAEGCSQESIYATVDGEVVERCSFETLREALLHRLSEVKEIE